MSTNLKIKLNENQNKEIDAPCSSCARETSHKIMVSVDTHYYDAESEFSVDSHYETIQCLGCKEISFRKISSCSEDWGIDSQGNEFIAYETTYFPGRISGRKKLEDSDLLPPKIALIYEETRNSLCNSILILSSAGMRALIEAVCIDREATGSNLEKKIDNLVQMGILTKDGADILHALRIMGNESIHEIAAPSKKALNMALDVVEHLLAGVYIIPAKAKILIKSSRKKKT